MNELLIKEKVCIENMIYEVRGKQVIIDSDLAKLYHVETKRINEAVKNNTEKFPERFSWVLSDFDWNNLRSIISTSRLSNYGGRRYLPRVFTEQGVAMLSTILKSSIATEVSINIMDAFVAMRKYISSNLMEQSYYNKMVIKHDNDIRLLQDSFDKLSDKVQNNNLFFEGQIYDAYSLLKDILNTSKNTIIIIDNYIDKNLLDILSKISKEVVIITNRYNNGDFEKYKKQYNNIILKINNAFHDRFIIIDNNTLYHCGASFKDLGKKCFAITKIEDNNYLSELLNKL